LGSLNRICADHGWANLASREARQIHRWQLRSQAEALLACDFFETVTLSGARLYVLAVIEQASRGVRILGATARPAASWVAQAARNLVMDLEDAGCRARHLIRDRDGKFPDLFGAILAEAGIDVVRSGVRMPRMNSIMERWVQACRRELVDRTLIWNESHLLHALREFEQFYSGMSCMDEVFGKGNVMSDLYGRCGLLAAMILPLHTA
jgi:transposase InsO family protein